MCMDEALKTKLIELSHTVTGAVIAPDDDAYEQARQTLFNKTARPAVIVQCASTDDVVKATVFARDNQLDISVRSGGHSGAGLSTNTGGLVIDLEPMHDVKIIDEAAHTVRVEGGAKWGDIAAQLAPHNLAISSGDTVSVGVGGLTLGGGIGWMVRGHGLAIDNLLAVEVVDGKGNKIRADKDEHADLFWAVRGGGGGFGIVTAFEFRAYPCKAIFGGHITYKADKREVIMQKWAEYMHDAPAELNSTIVLFPGFGPGAEPQLMLLACYAGDDDEAAQKALQPLRELGDTPISDEIKKKPYNEMLEHAMDVDGMKVRVRNGFVKELTPELMTTVAEHFGLPNTPPIQIRSLSGAMNDVDNDATAFAHRGNEGLVVMPSFTPVTATEEEANAAADKLWEPLKSYSTGAYVNFLTDIRPESIEDAYPAETRERLLEVKHIYDPDNLFHLNASVKP
jgi:FAD/FMN-containing dehydrogenase